MAKGVEMFAVWLEGEQVEVEGLYLVHESLVRNARESLLYRFCCHRTFRGGPLDHIRFQCFNDVNLQHGPILLTRRPKAKSSGWGNAQRLKCAIVLRAIKWSMNGVTLTRQGEALRVQLLIVKGSAASTVILSG